MADEVEINGTEYVPETSTPEPTKVTGPTTFPKQQVKPGTEAATLTTEQRLTNLETSFKTFQAKIAKKVKL